MTTRHNTSSLRCWSLLAVSLVAASLLGAGPVVTTAHAQTVGQSDVDLTTQLKIRRAMTRSRFMAPIAPQPMPAQGAPAGGAPVQGGMPVGAAPAQGGAPGQGAPVGGGLAGPVEAGAPVYQMPDLPQIVLPAVQTGPGMTVVNGCGDISIGGITDGDDAPDEQIIYTGDIIQICRD